MVLLAYKPLNNNALVVGSNVVLMLCWCVLGLDQAGFRLPSGWDVLTVSGLTVFLRVGT